ncbi:PAS domain S-box protein [Oceanibacterium hippocampi]|uniref:histidine kinase n=1 Tax=Oceanibacterium hippocampi TaxID=745714 RepID=A0A1Y5TYA6_9PROT|nr:PAS domain S-box protein [Oceanibacterium hippocampi]SLN75707.1 Blue-light-activated protein [Oceanibacterium hippocampi]
MTKEKNARGVPLRVLIVEDSEVDTELLVRELRRGGYEPGYRRVAQSETFNEALDNQDWDIILCDYTMPGFSGTEALSLLRDRGLDIPFIFVSGTIGEETAVAAMRAGAQDYVVKDNLKRLFPAIERELREAEMRRQRMQAESERRAVELKFREVLAMAPDAIVAADENQRITIFNRAAEALFGYDAAEVSGQPIAILRPRHSAGTDQTDPVAFDGQPDTRGLSGGPVETIWQRKNGEEFPAEASLSRLVDNGNTTFMAVIRDISGRKRDEATLRKLSRAVHHSASLIVITDHAGVIEYANPSLLRTMGFAADEVIGRKPSLWKSGAAAESHYAALWETVLAGRDWHGEFQNRCKDGSLISVFATISPIKDPGGQITHFISIQEDITQRKALESQLQQAQKMEAVGQLTGGMAHDFNNLLTVVIGNLDLLRDEFETRPTAQRMAQLALDASLRGADLTRKLLAFSRRQPLETKAFDLNALVAATTELLRRTIGEQISIELDLAADLWPALADPAQLEAALTNLAINARDAMPDGGTLTIATANAEINQQFADRNVEVTVGNYVTLAVSDTGTGMPQAILDKVFEPFFTTKEEGKGTGLGLSMIYGFVKQSGGHVWIDSEVGRGTKVLLYLPKAGGDPETVAGANGDEPEKARHDATVLVVEDNAEVRDVAVSQLRTFGYQVVEAEDGPAAMALLEQGLPVDLLFTDVVMPGGMSGLDLARNARRLRPELKVLFTTGFAAMAPTGDAMNGDNGNVLRKPYRKEELARKIGEALGGREPGT